MIPSGKILLERKVATQDSETRIVALMPDTDQKTVHIYHNENKVEEMCPLEFALNILLNH